MDYKSLYNNVPMYIFRSKGGHFIQVNIVGIVKSRRL
jgi:hypothetical protein